MSASEGVDCTDSFNNDVIHRKALWKQSLFMTYCRYTFLSCSPLLCQYVVSLGSIFTIWENSLRTKLTGFSACLQMTSLLKGLYRYLFASGCSYWHTPDRIIGSISSYSLNTQIISLAKSCNSKQMQAIKIYT